MFLGWRLPFFYFILAELEHRKWKRVASFFGTITLGSCKPVLAQGGFVCWGGISVIGDLAKLYMNCLNFATTSLGILLLSFCFGGS